VSATAVAGAAAGDGETEGGGSGVALLAVGEEVAGPCAAHVGVFRVSGTGGAGLAEGRVPGDAEAVEHHFDGVGDGGVEVHGGPGLIADEADLDVFVAVGVEVGADLFEDVSAVHVGDVADGVFGGDGVGEDGTGAAGVHVAAPDAVEVEGGAEGRHLEDGVGVVGDEAGDADVFGHLLEVGFGCGFAHAGVGFGGDGLDVVVEAGDVGGVAVGSDEGGEHEDVTPCGGVYGALEDAVDVRGGGTAAPCGSGGGELDVHEAFGGAGDGGGPGAALATEHEHGVGFLEELGVGGDELVEAHGHALFIAFGDDDEVDGELAVGGLDGHEGVELGHFGALGVDGSAADEDLLEGRVDASGFAVDETAFEGRCDPEVGLGDGHGVVHPVDEEGLGRAFVAGGVDDGVAVLAPLGDADVVDVGLLAAELVEEAFDHLGGLGDAFAGVGDGGLLDPLLEIFDVLIDVFVDVGEGLLLGLGHVGGVDLDGLIAVGTDAEFWSGAGSDGGLWGGLATVEEGRGEQEGCGEISSLHLDGLRRTRQFDRTGVTGRTAAGNGQTRMWRRRRGPDAGDRRLRGERWK
jgi:hypothetical protein